MQIKSYKDLIVWQKSIELVMEVYILTRMYPREELYGITSQMRRAVVSIPSNIAEGYRRRFIKESNQSNYIAYGSALELETQLIIAKKLQIAPSEKFSKCEQLLTEVIKMLNSMVWKYKIKVN